jgi:phospholipid transport system substrate-binding protein
MKPITILASAALWLAGAMWASRAAQAETAPDVLVKTTTEQVLALIRDGSDHRRLAERAQPLVVPHFDFARMTRLAVGKGWAKASPGQQQKLQDEFRDLLVRTYASALANGAGKNFRLSVAPLEAAPKGDEVTVHTRVVGDGGTPVAIDYQLEKAGADWKVYDVVVTGISLVTNYRETFAAEIDKSGVDGLIGVLHEKNKALETRNSG